MAVQGVYPLGLALGPLRPPWWPDPSPGARKKTNACRQDDPVGADVFPMPFVVLSRQRGIDRVNAVIVRGPGRRTDV